MAKVFLVEIVNEDNEWEVLSIHATRALADAAKAKSETLVARANGKPPYSSTTVNICAMDMECPPLEPDQVVAEQNARMVPILELKIQALKAELATLELARKASLPQFPLTP